MSRKQPTPPPLGAAKPDPSPAPPSVPPLCMAVEPALSLFRCTRELGHVGEHSVSDDFGERLEWPQSAAERAAASAVSAIDPDLLAAIRSALAAGCSAEDLIAAIEQRVRIGGRVSCPHHPEVDPRRMWGCPDCLAELRRENGLLRASEVSHG